MLLQKLTYRSILLKYHKLADRSTITQGLIMTEKKIQARANPTRASILKSAKKLFTRNGFAGSSMRMIATDAGINRSLISHHFGSKQQLWLAVKMDIVNRANNKSPILPNITLSWHHYLREWLFNNIQFYKQNPDIIAMINWQRTEHEKAHFLANAQSKETAQWIDVLTHYQKKGDIDQNIDLGFALTTITNLTSSAALDPNIFIRKKKDLEAYIDFCVNLIITGWNPQY